MVRILAALRRHLNLVAFLLLWIAWLYGAGRQELTINQVESAVAQAREANEGVCAVGVDSRAALRRVLIKARDQGLAQVTDQKTRDRINEFYGPLLAQIPAIECKDGEPVEVR